MPKDNLSWLSPRRRRTTGNLRNVPNAQLVANAPPQLPPTPTLPPILSRPNSSPRPNNGAPSAGLATLASSAKAKTALPARPSSAHRPQSQPTLAPLRKRTDSGNLFYAYARQTNESSSRYLLTFASASVAREWWLLVQVHFPRTKRPTPQLFTYPDDELMAAAWRHAAFAHIQSKWMYIALSVAKGRGVEGAGMIPVQDDWGNLLGGSTPSSPPRTRHSETIARETILDVDEDALSTRRGTSVDGGLIPAVDASRASSTDAPPFRGSLEAAPELVEGGSGQARVDGLDMSRILIHLDRIQTSMEELLSVRRQTSGDVRTPDLPTAADFSALTTSINELQRSVTAQSDLYQKILERQDSTLSDPKDDDESLLPEDNARPTSSKRNRGLESVLEELRSVRDTFGEHTERVEAALASRSSTSFEESEELGPKLDQVNDHLRVLREWTEFDSEHLQELLQLQRAAQDTPTSSTSTSSAISTNELAALNHHLSQIRLVLEEQQQQQQRLPAPNDRAIALPDHTADLTASPGTGDARFLLAALAGHLSKVQAVTEQNARHVASLRDHHTAAARQTHDILAALRTVAAAGGHQSNSANKLDHGYGADAGDIDDPRMRRLERGLEATHAHVRELMSGQRELVDVLRHLAVGLGASNGPTAPSGAAAGGNHHHHRGGRGCEHVVVPPPRKMGRKVVGFVYDTADGPLT